MEKLCKVKGCNKPVHAKEMCQMHYTRNTRYGDPLITIRLVYCKTCKENMVPWGQTMCLACKDKENKRNKNKKESINKWLDGLSKSMRTTIRDVHREHRRLKNNLAIAVERGNESRIDTAKHQLAVYHSDMSNAQFTFVDNIIKRSGF